MKTVFIVMFAAVMVLGLSGCSNELENETPEARIERLARENADLRKDIEQYKELDNKAKRLEKENTKLHEDIESLEAKYKKLKNDYNENVPLYKRKLF